MSRAYDYLKENIAKVGAGETRAFWTEYRRLAQLDKRDAEVNAHRRRLRSAQEMIRTWEAHPDAHYAAVRIERYGRQRDKALAWLAQHGYDETE